MFLRAAPSRDNRFQTSIIGRAHVDVDSWAYPEDSHDYELIGVCRAGPGRLI
jgi:hypothetical protein